MSVIDIHTHAFPDNLAEKAIPGLEKAGGIKAVLDGTIAGLLKSMDDAGIDISVIASIATKPEQFGPILAWSESIQSERVLPFPSFHPSDPEAIARIDEIAARGFKGIKLHPYYQDFITDDEKLFPLYRRISDHGLVLLIHAGYDIAFPRIPKASPERMANVALAFPALKLVVSHLGGWEDWEDAERHIIGKNIYVDVSVSLGEGVNPKAGDMILKHPSDYVLFGSDSPWESQAETAEAIRGLGLGPEREYKVLYGNAARLLG